VDRAAEEAAPKTKRIELDEAERRLLLKACKKYRYSVPAYLQSGQPELRLLDAVIRKLS
jgi:hypothetical protein